MGTQERQRGPRIPTSPQQDSDFPRPLIRKAERMRQALSLGDVSASELLQGKKEVLGITIDSSKTGHHDNAFWVQRDGDGYLVTISVTDVASVISRDSDFDQEAKKRGFINMLPETLSVGVFSFHDGGVRPAITLSMRLDSNLNPQNPTLEPRPLRVLKNYSYESVDSILNGEERDEYGDQARFSVYQELAEKLANKRRQQGAIVINERGNLVGLENTGQPVGRIIADELTILLDQLVPQYFVDHYIPMLYRYQIMQADGSYAVSYSTVPQFDAESGMPNYTHFDMPTGRFADLVNQRIFLAHYQGEPHPYAEALQELADYLNNLERRIRESGQAHGERERTQIPRRVKAGELLESLLSSESDESSGEAVSALRELLGQGKLSAENLYNLFFQVPVNPELVRQIQAEALLWLQRNPDLAEAIIRRFAERPGWSEVTYQPAKTKIFGFGSAHATTARIQKGSDAPIASDRMEASKAGHSKKLAAASLIAKLVNNPLLEQMKAELPPEPPPGVHTDYRNIYEIVLLQRQGWGPLKYESVPHEGPGFKIRAVAVRPNGEVVKYEPAEGDDIEIVRQAAVRNLLEAEGINPNERPKKLEKVRGQEDHFGRLRQFVQRSGWTMAPEQLTRQSRGDHVCTLTVITPQGSVVSTGAGGTQVEARRNAAQALFNQLSQPPAE